MRPLVISTPNRKGGVGKSTTTFNLSGSFAKTGLKTLVVEMDPQGTITKGFFGKGAERELTQRETVAALFDEELIAPPGRELVVPTRFENLFVARSNRTLDRFNWTEPELRGMRQYIVSEFLDEVGGDYEVVMIDSPPNLYLCTWNALLASDFVVVPVEPSDPGVQELEYVLDSVQSAKELNPRLQLLGLLIVKRRSKVSVHRDFESRLRAEFGSLVFETVVPLATTIEAAYIERTPITYSDPESSVGQAMEAVAEELMERIEGGIERQMEEARADTAVNS